MLIALGTVLLLAYDHKPFLVADPHAGFAVTAIGGKPLRLGLGAAAYAGRSGNRAGTGQYFIPGYHGLSVAVASDSVPYGAMDSAVGGPIAVRASACGVFAAQHASE